MRSEKLKFASAILVLTIVGSLMLLGSTATVSAQEEDEYVPPTPPAGIPLEVGILGVGIAAIAIIVIIGLLRR